MLGTASEEMAKSDKIWDSTNISALREQQEIDFGFLGGYEFAMPTDEGKWNNVTTNSGIVLGNKIIELLASSWLNLFIDVDDETRKKRESISNTERLANGCIWLADKSATSVPSGKRIQEALATYASVKGGTVKLVYLVEEEDGKLVPGVKVFDPMMCQWIEGVDEPLWFCNRNYVSRDYIEYAYKKEIKKGFIQRIKEFFQSGKDDRLLTYTFWDRDEWKMAVKGSDKWIDGDPHSLGYIPVNIRSCGAIPYIHSEKYTNPMLYSFRSIYSGVRNIYPLESKLLSIESSKAIESGKIKIAGEWDSAKSQNVLPEGIEKLGYGSKSGRNEIVLFDAAKGQKFGGMIQPPSNEIVERFMNRVIGMDIGATVDPIAWGQMNRTGSGALAAELRSAALEFINPFRKCIEADFVWIAEECVKQFKNGGFEKTSFEGRDRQRNKFYSDISPKDIEEKHFEAELVPDKLRDEIQELGAAIQKVQYGLSSRRTVMVKHNIVEDPDREIDAMDEELASHDPVFQYDKLAKYFKDLGTPDGDRMAQYYMALSAITIEKTVKQAIAQQLIPPPAPVTPGKPPVITPQAEAGRVVAEPQTVERPPVIQ